MFHSWRLTSGPRTSWLQGFKSLSWNFGTASSWSDTLCRMNLFPIPQTTNRSWVLIQLRQDKLPQLPMAADNGFHTACSSVPRSQQTTMLLRRMTTAPVAAEANGRQFTRRLLFFTGGGNPDLKTHLSALAIHPFAFVYELASAPVRNFSKIHVCFCCFFS